MLLDARGVAGDEEGDKEEDGMSYLAARWAEFDPTTASIVVLLPPSLSLETTRISLATASKTPS